MLPAHEVVGLDRLHGVPEEVLRAALGREVVVPARVLGDLKRSARKLIKSDMGKDTSGIIGQKLRL